MKYCCREFSQAVSIDRRVGPNIRIVKINSDEVELFDPSKPYRFFITNGYNENDKNVFRRRIEFCPFCGTKLDRYYNHDDYINEHNHSFISF